MAFILGYIIASWLILIGQGLSPLDLEKSTDETLVKRKLTIFNALNPLEPMNPGLYFILFANPD